VVDKHKVGRDGLIGDGVSSHALTPHDFDLERLAEESLSHMAVPRLYDSGNPHSRLFIANLDGTGNDGLRDPEHGTNVFQIHQQADRISKADPHIASGYIKGPGTQESFIPRTIDGAIGYSYDERIEKMYYLFVRQAKKWIEEDPKAEIRLLSTGFSRGADEALGLERLVHERGIRDPQGKEVVRNSHGHASVHWTLPPLREPGTTLQSALLFDPVGTGHPQRHDRRLTSSAVSGFQIVARDERRNQFPSTQAIPQGLSTDGRFLGVTVPGAHSDIGGSYHLDGLAVMHRNLGIDFINAGLDRPLFQKDALPTDSRRFAIHHSEEHLPIYGTSKFDRDGHRDSMGAQISPPHCRLVQACAPPEPLDPALVPMIGPRYPVTIGPVPEAGSAEVATPSMNAPSLTASSVAGPAAPPRSTGVTLPEPSRQEDVSMTWRNDGPWATQEKDFSINFRAFDHDRFKEVGNIPVARDVYDKPDRTPASSLSPVGRAATPDPAHERTLLEQVDRINAQVARELGRPPISAAPMKAQTHSPDQSMRTDVSPSIRPDNVQPLSARPVATERAQLSQAPGSPPPEHVRETQQHELAHRQWMDAPAGVPLVPPHTSQDRRQPEAERSAHDPRHRDHPDHALYQSINIQVAELHAREGIDVSNEQLDRVSTALLVEAKRNGVRQVTDVEFGQDANGRRTPDLIATEAFRGEPDDVRSRWAGIDASQAIAVPVETSGQQLEAVNQQLEQRMQQQQAQGMSEQQGMSMSR
jgi:hypothetical protein